LLISRKTWINTKDFSEACDYLPHLSKCKKWTWIQH